jgi:hypothetical protein
MFVLLGRERFTMHTIEIGSYLIKRKAYLSFCEFKFINSIIWEVAILVSNKQKKKTP